ncbi:MAG: hypothetical protein JWM53_5234 [bacterium]|nr:hypothetical protein [bacterium]
MTRLLRLSSLTVLFFTVACNSRSPKLLSATPATICANEDATVTLGGSDLQAAKVEIGSADTDLGGAPLVAATTLTGSGAMVMAKFAANSLTPSDKPYDLVYTDSNGKRLVLPAVITVVPGISIAAVDPATVYNGVDFPTSVYGTGMGAVQKIQIAMAGGAGVDLTSVKAIDNNRADAIVPMGTPPGTYDVTVVDANGCTATLPGALTVTADLTVSVCAIDPAFGFDMVDTDVTITATADGTAAGATCGGKSAKLASTPRAWLNIGGALVPLTNVAFNSAGSVTGTVPKGQTVGGPYDLVVQNPDGAVGVLTAAFKVVDKPVPQVTSIDPPSVPTNYAGTIKILGDNFRAPIKVEYYAEGAMPTAIASPTLVSANEVDITYPGNLAVGAYVLRVTDTDQGTYGEYSALAVISASFNITPWTDVKSSPLVNPTMRHGAAGGNVSAAARYLYVVGGDGGGATPTRYDATQIASVDKYGNVGVWFVGHNKLAAARTRLQLMSVPSSTGAGGHLYAVGGEAAGGAVATVSRAKILLPSEAPQVTKTTVTLGGTLTRGTWYYRVSAVLDSTDADNPLGETLTSEEVTAHTVDTGKVILEWSAVPKAATYRLYRTAMVNGTSKDEVLLADALTATSFTDDGTATAGSARPFAQGELGVWVDVAALNVPRRGLGLAMAHDPTGNAYLYAVGGDKGATATPAAADLYDTYEYAKLSADGATLAAWTLDATHKLAAARSELQSPVGEHGTSPAVGATTAYVYAVGGVVPNAAALALAGNYEAAAVQADGSLAWASGAASVKILTGLASIVTSNQLFVLGGENLAGAPQAVAASNGYTAPPVFGPTLNNDPGAEQDSSMTESIASLTALIFQSAHFYLVGGTVDGTTALQRVWSQPY